MKKQQLWKEKMLNKKIWKNNNYERKKCLIKKYEKITIMKGKNA